MYVFQIPPTVGVLMEKFSFLGWPPDVLRSTGDQQLGWMAMYVYVCHLLRVPSLFLFLFLFLFLM